jgi:transcriptional regulator with XRE-family HTH domain
VSATDQHAIGATGATPRLDGDVFDERCRQILGDGVSEEAKAELVGISRVTLHRYRKGELRPRFETARRLANRLDVGIDVLWPDAS